MVPFRIDVYRPLWTPVRTSPWSFEDQIVDQGLFFSFFSITPTGEILHPSLRSAFSALNTNARPKATSDTALLGTSRLHTSARSGCCQRQFLLHVPIRAYPDRYRLFRLLHQVLSSFQITLAPKLYAVGPYMARAMHPPLAARLLAASAILTVISSSLLRNTPSF